VGESDPAGGYQSPGTDPLASATPDAKVWSLNTFPAGSEISAQLFRAPLDPRGLSAPSRRGCPPTPPTPSRPSLHPSNQAGLRPQVIRQETPSTRAQQREPQVAERPWSERPRRKPSRREVGRLRLALHTEQARGQSRRETLAAQRVASHFPHSATPGSAGNACDPRCAGPLSSGGLVLRRTVPAESLVRSLLAPDALPGHGLPPFDPGLGEATLGTCRMGVRVHL
jgi:hypothetical protein